MENTWPVLDELEFASPKILHWINRKCEKRLRNENIAAQNDWMRSLYEENFRKKQTPKLVVKHAGRLIGKGLFSGEDISELTFIGEYTGVVRKRRCFSDRLNNYIFGYVVGTKDTPFVIDAKEKGNITRFINHSNTPNCTTRWMILENVCHVIFFANRLIKEGEQLTYNYGPHFWKNRMHPLRID